MNYYETTTDTYFNPAGIIFTFHRLQRTVRRTKRVRRIVLQQVAVGRGSALAPAANGGGLHTFSPTGVFDREPELPQTT